MYSFPDNAYCETTSSNTLSLIVNQITKAFKEGAGTIFPNTQAIALSLFRILLIIELAWLGIRMFIQKAGLNEILGEFIKVLLVAGIVYAIIINHTKWSNYIIEGLSTSYSSDFKGGVNVTAETNIINQLIGLINKVCKSGSWLDGIEIVICIIVMSVSIAMLTVYIVSILVESYVVLNIGVIVLGFGSLHFTREFTMNYLKYVLGVALKLLSMKILSTLLTNVLDALGTNSYKEFIDYVYTVIGVIIITGLYKTVPGAVAGLVSHAAISSGAAGAVMAAGASAFAGARMGSAASGGAISAVGGAAGGIGQKASSTGMGGKLGTAMKVAGAAGQIAGVGMQTGGAMAQGRGSAAKDALSGGMQKAWDARKKGKSGGGSGSGENSGGEGK